MNHLTMQLASFRCLLPVPLLLIAAVCNAEDSAIQSTARPQGLQPIAPVQTAASDAAANDFQRNHLPGISRYVNETLGERSQVDDSTMLLDTSILKLQNASDVRVYFVGEGAGYHNTLGLSTTGQKLTGVMPVYYSQMLPRQAAVLKRTPFRQVIMLMQGASTPAPV